MRRHVSNADATRKRRVNARRYVSRGEKQRRIILDFPGEQTGHFAPPGWIRLSRKATPRRFISSQLRDNRAIRQVAAAMFDRDGASAIFLRIIAKNAAQK